MKGPNSTHLSLGSNIEDRETNLKKAIDHLKKLGKITATSRIYETEPVGYVDQDPFLNITLKLETQLSPTKLLTQIQKTETKMGRKRTIPNGPRNIDIDILTYNNLELDTPELTIPHPRMNERAFVLVPLSEIAPELTTDPLKTLKDNHKVTPWTKKNKKK